MNNFQDNNSQYSALIISPDSLADKTPRVLMIGRPYRGRVIFVGLDSQGRFYMNKDGQFADLNDFRFMEEEVEIVNVVFCPNFLQLLIENDVHFNLEIPSQNYPAYNRNMNNFNQPYYQQNPMQNYDGIRNNGTWR